MVDVGAKPMTARRAVATAVVRFRPEVLADLLDAGGPKGDAFVTARLAGIGAAKRTAELIPLCHPLPLDRVDVELVPDREERNGHRSGGSRRHRAHRRRDGGDGGRVGGSPDPVRHGEGPAAGHRHRGGAPGREVRRRIRRLARDRRAAPGGRARGGGRHLFEPVCGGRAGGHLRPGAGGAAARRGLRRGARPDRGARRRGRDRDAARDARRRRPSARPDHRRHRPDPDRCDTRRHATRDRPRGSRPGGADALGRHRVDTDGGAVAGGRRVARFDADREPARIAEGSDRVAGRVAPGAAPRPRAAGGR